MGLIEAEEKKTDDEKIRAILAPYLDEIISLDREFLTDLGLIVSRHEGKYNCEVQAWAFNDRHKTAGSTIVSG